MKPIVAGFLSAALTLPFMGPAVAASPFERWERRAERFVAQRIVAGLERRGQALYYNGYRGLSQFRPGHRLFRGYWFPAAAFIGDGIATSGIGD